MMSSLPAGGQVDSLRCVLPVEVKGRDVRSLPAEMFLRCLHGPSPSWPRPPRPPGGEECVRPRPRPPSVRRARGTQAVVGVVCGTVGVMMVAAGAYGCVYASLMARCQQGARGTPLITGGGGAGASVTSPEQEEEDEEEVEEAPSQESCPVVHGYRISSF